MTLGYADIYPGSGADVAGASADATTVQPTPVGKAPAFSWLTVVLLFVLYRIFYEQL